MRSTLLVSIVSTITVVSVGAILGLWTPDPEIDTTGPVTNQRFRTLRDFNAPIAAPVPAMSAVPAAPRHISDERLMAASIGTSHTVPTTNELLLNARLGSCGDDGRATGLEDILNSAAHHTLSPADWEIRFRLAGAAGVTADQAARAASFLHTRPPGLGLSTYRAISNDLIDAIVRGNPRSPATLPLLLSVVRDPSTDPVVADYIVQHLDTLRDLSPDRAIVDAALLKLAGNPRGTVAGAACLVIGRAYRQENWNADEPETRSVVLSILGDPSVLHESKSAALSLCHLYGWTEALVSARSIAADPGAQIAARLAAVRLIASLGTADDRIHLGTLAAESRNPMLLHAIQASLNHS